jgi:hypothetical protein
MKLLDLLMNRREAPEVEVLPKGAVPSAEGDPLLRHAVNQMLNAERYFSISRFDVICETYGFVPPKGVRERLRLLHCDYYRDMDDETRAEFARLLSLAFSSGGFEITVVVKRTGGNVVSIR